ncbi:MAG: tRNA preQ1(34) S-adenosylmethionine ribosyltransferase-isomerase QueA [Betaproteobacteria bacterium]|nr:tRNA preQ1(34) S-adenosylmethionine ribosyltransferase-isomerase QueA [Betaproteobacteria bacterium]
MTTVSQNSLGAPIQLSDFDFQLPPDLIAQHPCPERSASRLLDARHAEPQDRIFKTLPTLMHSGDLLVFNDTQVIKARLFGHKSSGGKVELLVERVLPGHQVVAHMKVSKKPLTGAVLHMDGRSGSGFEARLIGRWPDEQGALFCFELSGEPHALMALHGHVPLPPYIERHDDDTASLEEVAQDEQRYQTVFARTPGAVAAPTAALHFDEGVLADLQAMGVHRASVTLHVGAGTFQPVKTQDISQHQMHSEWCDIPEATQQALKDCKARGASVWAVGTTTVRSIESWAQTGQAQGDTQIFITPGFEFQWVDHLLTNFHLPKSSLMMLVSAFAGHEKIMRLYAHAIAQRYRFFSYGDAMLLSRSAAS